MTTSLTFVQATAAVACAEAVLFAATSTGAGQVLNLLAMSLSEVEAALGGSLEVVQLDAQTCLLVNAEAFTQHQPKNMPASQRWFARNPESGLSADFIRGNAILCQNSQMAHLDHLHAEVKPILTAKQRAERAAAIRSFGGQQQYEEAKLACSLDNPQGCEMCGA